MFAGFGSPEDTNARFHHLLSQGQSGLSTAFDMPSLMGYDPDHRAVDRRGRARGRLGGPRGRHAAPVRRHRPRGRLHLDDDLGPRARRAGAVRGRRRGVGRAPRGAARHPPDGHPQGVHRPEGVGGRRAALDAAGCRPDRVLRRGDAAVAPDLGVRVPHPRGRGDGRPGAGLHARRRPRLRGGPGRPRPRSRRVPAAFLLLLQLPHRLLRGGREDPRGPPAVGLPDARPRRREEPEVVAAAHAHPDLGRLAERAAAAAEPGAHRHRGARRRDGRHPVAAHQLVRRDAVDCRRSNRPRSRCARSR